MAFYQAPDRAFNCTQWVPRPLNEVFEFFASEQNLETITPPWLSFRVLGKSTPSIEKGTLIDYQIKLSGIPMKWRTEIVEWEPGVRFVDVQLRGPYKKWHHTHCFTAEHNGTRIDDRVIYQLPLGLVGDLAAGWKVRRQVQEIFAYRTQIIDALFGPPKPK